MPKNYEDLKNRIALVRGLVPIVQVDICDGRFVKNTTWPYDDIENPNSNFAAILHEDEGMPFWEDIDFELDLMVVDAVENFDMYAKLSPTRMIFHFEAMGDPEAFREYLEGIDIYVRDSIEIGVAFGPQTSLDKIYPLVSFVDFVQVMGIEKIGWQGEPFDYRAVDNVKMLKSKYPEVVVSVDGGVDFETAQKLIDAGADRLVIGSAIFKSMNIKETIRDFEDLV